MNSRASSQRKSNANADAHHTQGAARAKSHGRGIDLENFWSSKIVKILRGKVAKLAAKWSFFKCIFHKMRAKRAIFFLNLDFSYEFSNEKRIYPYDFSTPWNPMGGELLLPKPHGGNVPQIPQLRAAPATRDRPDPKIRIRIRIRIRDPVKVDLDPDPDPIQKIHPDFGTGSNLFAKIL